MALKSVEALSLQNIKTEQAIRKASAENRKQIDCIEAVVNDPELQKLTKAYHIDTADYRVDIAEAGFLLEKAHSLLANIHLELNAEAEKRNIDNPGPDMSTKEGGGR